MFLTSGPDLVVETCRSGLVGAFPALNQRTTEGFVDWLGEIRDRLAEHPDAAPFAVNLIAHRSNPRLDADLRACVEAKVPLVITSLGAVRELVDAVHGYGGLVFHDVVNLKHAANAAAAGVDGIIAVAAGAGGHAGTMSPFALVNEIRARFDVTVILSGAMSTGRDIAAARMMGADLAYLGTRFLATREALVSEAQKQMTIAAAAGDIVYTPVVSGVPASFLRESLVANGVSPDGAGKVPELDMNHEAKAWKTVWSAGQGVGSLSDIPPAAELCQRLIREYRAAKAEMATDPYGWPRDMATDR
jgi:nitronate monooxygenase